MAHIELNDGTISQLAPVLRRQAIGEVARLSLIKAEQRPMMVMKDGGYTFTDFMRYGFPVQLIHMAITMVAIWLISDVLGFEGFQ